jgi:hypothetical protein
LDRDLEWMRSDRDQLAGEIQQLEIVEENTLSRHENPAYEERSGRVALDVRENPSNIDFIPDRARVIARDFGLDPSIVEQDIRGLLA